MVESESIFDAFWPRRWRRFGAVLFLGFVLPAVVFLVWCFIDARVARHRPVPIPANIAAILAKLQYGEQAAVVSEYLDGCERIAKKMMPRYTNIAEDPSQEVAEEHKALSNEMHEKIAAQHKLTVAEVEALVEFELPHAEARCFLDRRSEVILFLAAIVFLAINIPICNYALLYKTGIWDCFEENDRAPGRWKAVILISVIYLYGYSFLLIGELQIFCAVASML
jgi:hypothetical protein